MELFQASHQWRSRPSDERFVSLVDMADHFNRIRAESRQMVSTTGRIEARPAGEDMEGMEGMELLVDKIDEPVNPTHHAFGQLAQLAKAPAYYLRTLPSPIAADCFNYGLRFKREIDDVGLLTHHNGSHTLRAATVDRRANPNHQKHAHQRQAFRRYAALRASSLGAEASQHKGWSTLRSRSWSRVRRCLTSLRLPSCVFSCCRHQSQATV